MAELGFDPSQSVKFDFVRGAVEIDGGAHLLVPTSSLLALCRGAGAEALRDFGRGLGTELGRRVAGRIRINEASVESVVTHLGGDLALVGLGSLGVERWGQALVLTVTTSPLDREGDALVAAVLEGALQRAMARDVAVVPLSRENGQARLVVTSASAAGKVRAWLGEGVSWGDVLARLHEARSV
jgi:hypothetical protein